MAVFKFSGGPVQASEIYIERRADHEVLRQVRALDYAHVIAPRQMGKTSLLQRLSRQLTTWGWRCVYVDLSELKATDEAAWYYILGQRVGDQLTPEQLPTFTGPNDLKTYLVSVLVHNQPVYPIILLLDEIGNAQKLASCEQFFLTLRSMYRQPADYPVLKDFSLVLAGTVDPDSLVKDTSNSPFNYGERVPLYDFNVAETRQLTASLNNIYS
ncbi:AAA-like domain-containing protein, partial [Candidatus Microgenomates bacterium]|nr:AAA-like domain-containing protein [Candidatus Microgenomates bacterium]